MNKGTELFHLAVAWDWELDRDFIQCLEREAHNQGKSFYSLSHHNIDETLARLKSGEIQFGSFLDRASDADPKFLPIVRWLLRSNTITINPPEKLNAAIDKATMHLEFLSKGIDVPFTIIISPYNKRKELELSLSDLARLGRPFIIKPANTTGAGTGVILGAETLKDVIETRQHHRNDKYLLQERISPDYLGGTKGWFRVFSVFGTIIPCWWDDETHIYRTLSHDERDVYNLSPLYSTTKKIWEVCGMDFFSTEIVRTTEGKFVVVDYVNEICDMRLQSQHRDGVPDEVVQEICRRIVEIVN